MQLEGAQMEANRIRGLDGLRAIAIVGVVLFHLYPYDVVGGYVGVCLFFVLSGFLLGYRSFLDMSQMKFHALRFYGKRLLRIYPGLFAMVFVTCGGLFLLSPQVLHGRWEEVLSIFLGYNNWWQIIRESSYFARISGSTPFLHIWSLAIELQFYLIYPLIFYAFLWMVKHFRKRGAWLILVMITLFSAIYLANGYMLGMDNGRMYYGTDTRVFSFLIGVCGGYYHITAKEREERSFPWLYYLAFVALLGLLVVCVLWMSGEDSWAYIYGMQGMSVAFLAMIVLCADERLAIGRILDVAPLRYLGSRSYEIYLWHYPVVFYLHYRKWMQRPEYIALGILLSLALAEWTYQASGIFIKHRYPKLVGKIVFFIVSLGMIGMIGLGIYGFATTATIKSQDTATLQTELEDSTRALEKQQKEIEEKALPEQPEETKVAGYSDGQAVVDLNSVTIIGDSVCLSASEELLELLPAATIDAKESRQMKDAIEIVKQMKEDGTLGSTVVIALGTNGFFWQSEGQVLINEIGTDHNIFWVNVYGQHLEWQYRTNGTIRTLVRDNPNVQMISWVKLIRANQDWLYDDGIHVEKEGQQAYAQMIYDALNEYVPKE